MYVCLLSIVCVALLTIAHSRGLHSLRSPRSVSCSMQAAVWLSAVFVLSHSFAAVFVPLGSAAVEKLTGNPVPDIYVTQYFPARDVIGMRVVNVYCLPRSLVVNGRTA
jgi:hypothetical protein